jgi:hypothetical protein
MAFGATSAIFQQALLNPIMGRCWTTAVPTSYSSLSADSVMAALYNNTGTPSKSVTLANSCYLVDQWVTGNEVIDSVGPGTNWAAGGRALASKAFSIDTGSSSVCFQAAALSGAGNVSIANAYGCLIYDTTITGAGTADQGLCYNSFGGSAQGVVAGTFTILWATVGALTNVVIFNVAV